MNEGPYDEPITLRLFTFTLAQAAWGSASSTQRGVEALTRAARVEIQIYGVDRDDALDKAKALFEEAIKVEWKVEG